MDMDRLFYIFGSFARKKDKRKSQPPSISAGNSPLHQRVVIPPRTSAYVDDRIVGKEWYCGICRQLLVEPRLLTCLHSFCTRCLQGLYQEGQGELWSNVDGSFKLDRGGSRCTSASAASGYESELRTHSGSDASWPGDQLKYGISRKISGKSVNLLLCPTCGEETALPFGGIAALPLNYVLMKRMDDLHIEPDTASVLCDLCNCDTRAQSRCSQCLVSVCEGCEATHARQAATARHALRPLTPSPPATCATHQARNTVYCATCQEVVCRDCSLLSHSGHALSNASRAAAERARQLREACEKARQMPRLARRAVERLERMEMEVDNQAAQVQTEVETFVEKYTREVECHCRALQATAARARDRYRKEFQQQKREIELKAKQAEDAANFAEDVLSDGSPTSVLALAPLALRRVTWQPPAPAPAPPRCNLRFSPAPVDGVRGRLVEFGGEAVLDTNGLQDLRVGETTEVLVELPPGAADAEQVAAYLRRKECTTVPLRCSVRECAGGARVSLRPPAPGHYYLAVTLGDVPIQGSPFSCSARLPRPATAAAAAGRRNSTPNRLARDSTVYQFSL